MTAEQLAVARAHCDDYCTRTLGYSKSNILFVQGLIEKLEEAGIEAGAYNVCLSNCVLNLSPDKPAVLREVYRALSDGGEFYFSDIYSTSCLAPEVRLNPLLWGECLAGCLQVEEFEEYARGAGFQHPRVLALSPVEIYDASLRDLVGGTRFFSITYRLFKLSPAEAAGSVAVCYTGTIPGLQAGYQLDVDTYFETGQPLRVDEGTAQVLSSTWLKRHFEVTKRGAKHFDCSPSRRSVRDLLAASSSSPPCCC